MNSLEDLNQYSDLPMTHGQTGGVYSFSFNTETPVNQSVTVSEGGPFSAPTGIEVTSLANPPATWRLSFDLTNGGLNVEFPDGLPTTMSLTQQGNVWHVDGIAGPLTWNYAKNAKIRLVRDSLTPFTYTTTLSYRNLADTATLTKSWTTSVTVNDLSEITTPQPTTYDEDHNTMVGNYPQITDVENDGTGVYTITVTPSTTSAIKTMSSNGGSTATSTFNDSTKVLTISGDRYAVNAELAGIMFVPAKDFASNFTLTYRLTNPGSGLVTTVTQAVNIAATQTELTTPGTHVYDQDVPGTITNTPQINDYINPAYLNSYVLSIVANNSSAIYGIASSGMGGNFSFNSTSRTATITGTKDEINNHLGNLQYTPGFLFGSNFSLGYTLTAVESNVATTVDQLMQVGNTHPVLQTAGNVSYDEDQPTLLDPAVQVGIGVTQPNTATVTMTVQPTQASGLNDPALAIESWTFGGNATNVSVSSTTKTASIQGYVADVNSTLSHLTMVPAMDYTGNIVLTYTMTSPDTPIVANTVQYINIRNSNEEIANINNNRTYDVNGYAKLFPNNTPYIPEVVANATYKIELTTTANIGSISHDENFTTGWNWATKTYTYTGTRDQVNAVFANVRLYALPDVNTNTTITYKQYRNNQLQYGPQTFNITSITTADQATQAYTINEAGIVENISTVNPVSVFSTWAYTNKIYYVSGNTRIPALMYASQAGTWSPITAAFTNVAPDVNSWTVSSSSYGGNNVINGISRVFAAPATLTEYLNNRSMIANIGLDYLADYNGFFHSVETLQYGATTRERYNTILVNNTAELNWNNTSITDAVTTLSDVYTEDVGRTIGFGSNSLVIVDSDPVTPHYQARFVVNSGSGNIWVNGVNQGVDYLLPAVNTYLDKTAMEANVVKFVPARDYSGNVQVYVDFFKQNSIDTKLYLNLTATSTAEYEFNIGNPVIYVDYSLSGVQILDNSSEYEPTRTYTATLTSAAYGSFYTNGVVQGSSLSFTGTRDYINAQFNNSTYFATRDGNRNITFVATRLDDGVVLANVTSSINAVVPAIGTVWQGGYYGGKTATAGQYYAYGADVEMSYNAGNQQNPVGIPNGSGNSTATGEAATNYMVETLGYTADSIANYCYNYVSNGYTDWFMPSQYDLVVMSGITNFGPGINPPGALVNNRTYVSSTVEVGANTATTKIVGLSSNLGSGSTIRTSWPTPASVFWCRPIRIVGD